MKLSSSNKDETLISELQEPAILLDLRTNRHQNREAYISFVGEDKRLDVWVREGDMGAETTHASEGGPSDGPGTTLFSSKRKCEDEVSCDGSVR